MSEVKMVATRAAYGAALKELGAKRDDFVVLDADLAAATQTGAFKKEFPDRFYDCGIAEQNMISIAAGIAATGKKVICSSFAMFASSKGLSNLTAFVDNNNLQIDGTVEEVNSPYPIDKKFEAFGWHTIVIDGHDFDQIEAALVEAKTVDKPVCIIANTVKGKGVSYMENQVGWHGSAPNDELAAKALEELDAQLNELMA